MQGTETFLETGFLALCLGILLFAEVLLVKAQRCRWEKLLILIECRYTKYLVIGVHKQRIQMFCNAESGGQEVFCWRKRML